MNEKIKLRIKQILSAIALFGNTLLLRDSFYNLSFELRYFTEYKEISWLLRYVFFVFVNFATLLLLLDYFMKITREIRVARDIEVENEIHREYAEKKILKDSDEVDPEELKDLLQKDYSSQKKSSHM